MDWNRIEGNWKQFKGSAKEKWGKLTDDDLSSIEGRREQLEGRLQERYGKAKDQVRQTSTTGSSRCIEAARKKPRPKPGLFCWNIRRPAKTPQDISRATRYR